MCTLLDRAYEINNTLLGFKEDVKKLSYTLKRNQFPEHLINKVSKACLYGVVTSTTACRDSDAPPDGIYTLYFKLPYLAFSDFAQRKVRKVARRYCRNLNIKLAFSSFKIKTLMDVKTLYLDRSILMQFKSLFAQNVIPLMLVRQADICLHNNVSILIQIKTLSFLHT